MRIGIFLPTTNPMCTPDYLAAFGAAAEERGFSSIWVPEHVVLFDEYGSSYPYASDGRIPAGGENGMLDPLTTLGFLAAATSTIRLGTGICLVPQRNPVYTAKEVATVDWLSNGRVDFGIGVGWLAEEFEALAMPFEARGERSDEFIEVMRALWCNPVSEYHGRHYDLPACRQYPKPVQQPHPPIHVGGESNRALRRVADLGNGWYGFNQLPDQIPERLAQLDKLLAERGRTRADIEVSICPYLQPVGADALTRYHQVGVDQLVMMVFAFEIDGARTALDELAASMVEPRAHAVKTLYLLRHVKSSWEGDDIPDHDRPLAPRGERAARRLGAHFKSSDVHPALVLCSSARRAQETLAGITRALKSAAEPMIEEDLYGASASDLLARLRKVAASTPSVMVIGHNPGLQDLALVLTGDGDGKAVDQLRAKFPTGALATLDLAGEWRKLGPGCAYLESVVVPRQLD